MKKILVYGLTPNIGGLETYIMYQYRAFDRSLIHMDFINDHNGAKVAFHDEIISKGSTIYNLTGIRTWYSFLKEHKGEYDIIIFNSVNPFLLYMLEMVRLMGSFKRIIIHSHNGGIDTFNFIKKISYPAFVFERLRFKLIGAEKWACSKIAAKWMFGSDKNCTIIKNGIETENFRFKPEIRKQTRKELSLTDNDFVVGHIGRFAEQKNHLFLIDVFKEISEKEPNAKLLLIGGPIGNGQLLKDVKKKVKNLKLEEKVIFLGMITDTERFYQAMDIFLLPSLFEGLPVVGVEAQCAGLPVIFSDTITNEVKINDNVSFLPINDEKKWGYEAIRMAKKPQDRINSYKNVIQSGFDVRTEVKHVEKLLTTG